MQCRCSIYDLLSVSASDTVLSAGSHRISDPAPLVRDPRPLITDRVPHSWDPAPFCWDPPLCTVYIWVFFSIHNVFFLKCSPSRPFCQLHLFMLGVDKCCKCKTLFKCHKSQTECPECSKTPGRRSGTSPTLGSLGSSFSPSSLAPIGIHHLLLSNLIAMSVGML